MELTFLGGANEIGASCAVLDLGGRRLLIDCGQRMGAPPGQALPDFSFLESGPPVDAILLTHSHADHIGALPALESFLPANCPIYATEPTLSLARVMLEDSVRIMTQFRQSEGEVPHFPPTAVPRILARLKGVRWGKPVPIADAVATWFPAGHILGAAMIEVHNGQESVLFSGDVSVSDQCSVPGLFVPAIRPSILVLESTYGNRLHAHRPAQEQRLIDRVADCLAEGGHVLFPTFALGRAQEVLLILGRAIREGKLPAAPIYADGLVRTISKVYARFPDELAPGCRRLWEEGLDPIFPEDLPITAIKNNDHREQVAAGEACVVVASSGMLQGGASQFYARQWIGDASNLLLITGYQDEESPGQALLQLAELPPDQPRFFKLGGIRTEVRARVESCQLSAHADNGELVALAAKLQPKVIFPVHGDAVARECLARNLMATCKCQVILSANGETHRLLAEAAAVARPVGRMSPLSHWPPWDPFVPRELDLSRFHAWLAGLTPPIQWITIEELAELWRHPDPVIDEDRIKLREQVYGQSQPYFVPDTKRPYLLRIVPPANIEAARGATQRMDVAVAARVVRELFPPSSGLARFGFFPEEKSVRLEFQFPRAARRHYLRRLAELVERTGWQADLSDRTLDADLIELVQRWVGPAEIELSHDRGTVRAIVAIEARPADADDIAERFNHKTGYQLELVSHSAPQPA